MIKKLAEMLRRKFFPSELEKNALKWIANDGDATHRLHYPQLNSDSIVFDLGGFKGQFASDLYSKYFCKVYVFEPVLKFYRYINDRFNRNNNIHVFQLALGNKNSKEPIFLSGDATSLHRQLGSEETITFKRFDDFLNENNIDRIDLLKINIEGAEYDLLEFLIKENLISKIYNIQVQFHDFIPQAAERMKRIQQELTKTHELTYQYRFIWENWKLKQE